MTRTLLALVFALLAVAAFLVLRWSGAGPATGALASAPGADTALAPASSEEDEGQVDLTAEEAPAGPGREVVPEAGGGDSPLEGTQVVVRVLDAETDEPIAGASVSLSESGGSRLVESAVGVLGQSLTTGADGRVWFEAKADIALRGRARSERHQRLRYELEPLAEGEVREHELSLERHEETPMHYRLVDAESGRPVAGVVAHATSGRPRYSGPGADGEAMLPWTPVGEPVAESDADGRLVLVHDTATQSAAFDLFADGYGPLRILPNAGWDDPTAPREVALQRAGKLTFDATSRPERLDLEADDVTVFLGKFSQGSLVIGARGNQWRPLRFAAVPAGAAGLFEVTGLPPDVELQLQVHRGEEVLFELSGGLFLAPGEQRTVEWSVPTEAELTGLVTRGDAPVPDRPVQLLQAEPGADRRLLRGNETAVASARTDGVGRFRFEAVVPGTYWLCAAPAGRTEGAQAVRVVVPSADDVLLELLPEATIEGRVTAGGEPMPGARMYAFEQGTDGGREATTDDAGAFRLEVPDRGLWRIVAFPPGREYGTWSAVGVDDVAPGTRDLALALARAKTLLVEVTDANERPIEAWIDVIGADGDGGVIAGGARSNWSFLGQGAGEYLVFAHTNGGLVGTTRVTLDEDDEEVTATVQVTPGARVRIVGDDIPPNANFLLTQDGKVRARLSRLDGMLNAFTVPPGSYRVTFRARSNAPPVDLGTHTFAAGQVTELPYSD